MSLAARRVHSGLTILGCFGGGSLYGWSGYMPAVRAQFALNAAAASMVFSLALVSFTIGVLLGPYLLARISARYRLALLAGLAVVALGLAGASAGFVAFVLSYGLCFGFIAGVLYNHAISTASACGSATLLVPLSVAAFGVGGAVFGSVQVWLGASGWALWSVTPALICFAIVAVLGFVVRLPPVSGAGAPVQFQAMIKPDRTILTLGLIFAAGSCAGLVVLGFTYQFLPMGSDGIGLASLALFMAAIGNTLGRLTSTLSIGWLGPSRAIAGAITLSMIALCGLIFANTPGVVVALLFLVAFAYGKLAASMPLLVKSQVSDTEFASAFGWVFIGWGTAGLIGPWGTGWLKDATGSMQISLIICVALCGLGLWLVGGFVKSDRPSEDC